MAKNKRLKVICFAPYPSAGPSVRHRISAYAPAWRTMGIDLTLKSFMSAHFYKIRRRFGLINTALKICWFIFCTLRLFPRLCLIPFYDVLIIHREIFPLGQPWFELIAIKLAKKSIYDVDDAIWFQPSNAVNQRAYFYDKDRVAKIMIKSDQIVICNQFLKHYADQFNDSVYLIPTPYDLLEPVQKKQTNKARTTIFWLGNLGNAFYLNEVIEALEVVAAEYAIQLHLMGGVDIYQIKSDKIKIIYSLWSEQAEQAALMNADIGIMPLLNQDYEQGKCAFKIIQYFSAHLAVIASPIGMNVEVIQPKINGFLAKNKAAWIESLQILLADKAYQKQCGEQGYQYYRKYYRRQINAQKWANLLLSSDFNI